MRDKLVKINICSEPIIMFGGSPINVAAPATLDTSTCDKTNGIGDRNFNILTTDNVTGTMSRMVVTLSMNMDAGSSECA